MEYGKGTVKAHFRTIAEVPHFLIKQPQQKETFEMNLKEAFDSLFLIKCMQDRKAVREPFYWKVGATARRMSNKKNVMIRSG